MIDETTIEQRLVDETKNRGYDYLSVGEAHYHNAIDIVICDRDAPTEYSNEGEYLTCVWYDYDTEQYFVYDGEGYGGLDYDVTNGILNEVSFEDAFNAVDRLFEEQQ